MQHRAELVPVGPEFLTQWERDARRDINTAITAGAPRADFAAERELLAEFRMVTFWGAHAFALHFGGQPNTVIIAGFNKRGRPGWGRYINVFAVHTHTAHRGRGGAVAAYRALAAHAASGGWERLVTTAGSVGGWRTHRALGWAAWGANTRGEIVTDTAIGAAPEPPGVPPRSAKLAGPGRPLRPAEHTAILTDPHGAYRAPAELLPERYRKEAPCTS